MGGMGDVPPLARARRMATRVAVATDAAGPDTSTFTDGVSASVPNSRSTWQFPELSSHRNASAADGCCSMVQSDSSSSSVPPRWPYAAPICAA